MKIQGLITIALIIILFSSCSKDEIDNLSDSELLGFWRISDVYFEGTSTVTDSGGEVTAPFSGTGYNLALSIDFSEIENEFTSKGSYNVHLATKTDGEEVITEWMNPGFIECGTWQKEGNSIVVSKPNGESKTALILSMQQSLMVLSYDFSYEVMKSETMVIYNVKGIFTFQKQLE